MISEKKEALYLVDNEVYLHLKQTTGRRGFSYETFDNATGTRGYTGTIPYENMRDRPIRSSLAMGGVPIGITAHNRR